jgi:hypothetical protein
LRQRENVGKLTVCHPSVFVHDIKLDHGDHSVSTTKTEQSDFEETPE